MPAPARKRTGLRRLVKELSIEKNVSFSGRVDTQQMPALYQSAQIMLNPSRVDNMPNSILESLASGVPVVSTNVGGIPFLVEHEKTALLVPAENHQAMAQAALRILQDEQLTSRFDSSGSGVCATVFLASGAGTGGCKCISK